jgi:hypothetical protein
MTDLTERRLGFGFGLLGGALIALGGLVSLVAGAADMIVGHTFAAASAGSLAIVLFVVGGLALLFSWLGHRNWKDRPLVSGVMLVVIAAIGWGVLGFGANLIALIGAIFVFLSGMLYLVEPVRREVHAVATA